MEYVSLGHPIGKLAGLATAAKAGSVLTYMGAGGVPILLAPLVAEKIFSMDGTLPLVMGMLGFKDFQEKVKNPILRLAQDVDCKVCDLVGVKLVRSTTSRGTGSDFTMNPDAHSTTLGNKQMSSQILMGVFLSTANNISQGYEQFLNTDEDVSELPESTEENLFR